MLLLDGKFIDQIERKRGFPHSAHSPNRHQCTRIEVPQEFIKMPDTASKGVEILGKNNMILDPDCGLRRATKDVAFNKLKLMNSIKDEYS